MITNNARGTCEIKSRIAMAAEAFIREKPFFTRKLGFTLRKKLVNKLVKCYIWIIIFYGAET